MKIQKKQKTWIEESIEKMGEKPEDFACEDIECEEKKREQAEKEMNKRLEPSRKNGEKVKGEDHVETKPLKEETETITSYDVKDRKELASLLEELHLTTKDVSIKRSVKEGCRYQVTLKSVLNETKEVKEEESINEARGRGFVCEYKGYHIIDAGDRFVITKNGLNVGETKFGLPIAKGMIDELVKEEPVKEDYFDNLSTSAFVSWHDKKVDPTKEWSKLEKIYAIFKENGCSEDDDIDVCYEKCSNEQKHTIKTIIGESLEEVIALPVKKESLEESQDEKTLFDLEKELGRKPSEKEYREFIYPKMLKFYDEYKAMGKSSEEIRKEMVDAFYYPDLIKKVFDEKESLEESIDKKALEFYVKNWNEGDNITVTSDLLNVLEQSLDMIKKYDSKEECLHEDVNHPLVGKKVIFKDEEVTIEDVIEDDEDNLMFKLSNKKMVDPRVALGKLMTSDDEEVIAFVDAHRQKEEPKEEPKEKEPKVSDYDKGVAKANEDFYNKDDSYYKKITKELEKGLTLKEFDKGYYDTFFKLKRSPIANKRRNLGNITVNSTYKGDVDELVKWLKEGGISTINVTSNEEDFANTQGFINDLNKRDNTSYELKTTNKQGDSYEITLTTNKDILDKMPEEVKTWIAPKNSGKFGSTAEKVDANVFSEKDHTLTSNGIVKDLLLNYGFHLGDYKEKKEALEESNKDTTTFLNLECGVLLNPGDEEYEFYKSAYDGQFGYYDETYMNGLESDLDHLKQVGLSYIKEGVNGTYAIITKIVANNDEYGEDAIIDAKEQIKEYGFIDNSVDFLDGEQFEVNNVVWSAYKNNEGDIVENFVGNAQPKEEKVEEGIISGEKELSYDELANLEKELFDKLKEKNIYPDDGTFSNASNNLADLELYLVISGDWKHDHLATNDVVENFCKEKGYVITKHDEQELEDSGNDWYDAEHTWYLIKDVDGKMEDRVAGFKKMFARPENESLKEELDKETIYIKYWENEDLREQGMSEIYLDKFENVDDAKEVARKLVDRDGYASVEVFISPKGEIESEEDKLVWGYDGVDTWNESLNKEPLKEGRYLDLNTSLSQKKERLEELKEQIKNAPTEEAKEELEISIEVLEKDIADIENELAKNESLNEKLDDGRCPYCHSENIDFVDSDEESTKYVCRDCGEDFIVDDETSEVTDRHGRPIEEDIDDDFKGSEDLVDIEDVDDDFGNMSYEEKIDFLKADEEEAIEGYDKVIDNIEDEHVKDQLEHIKEEEVAHKEFLDAVKEDPSLTYEEHDEEHVDNTLAPEFVDPEDADDDMKIGDLGESFDEVKEKVNPMDVIPQEEQIALSKGELIEEDADDDDFGVYESLSDKDLVDGLVANGSCANEEEAKERVARMSKEDKDSLSKSIKKQAMANLIGD